MSHVQVATQVQKQKCVATNLHATENHWSITASYTIRVLQKSAPPDISSQVAFKINDYHVNDLRKTPLCQYHSDGSCSSINMIGLLNLFLSLYGFKRICRKLRSFLTFYIKSRERFSRNLLYIQFNMIFNVVFGETVDILNVFLMSKIDKTRKICYSFSSYFIANDS